MKRRIELGLLYSRSGSYSLISDACRTGALAAIARANADPSLGICLFPVERDTSRNIDAYGPLCEENLRDTGARHVVGGVASWSRKQVIPTVEKYGGTLWYAVSFEGFEVSDHVVYPHACPNQHLLPLLDRVMSAHGRRAFLACSNYIWGWEMNRLARERITAAGGEVLGDRYLPIGSRDVERMIDEVRFARPDFILNSLIGASSCEFMIAYRALGLIDPHFLPESCPVLSCNLTECELPALGQAAEGLVVAGPYFRGVPGWPRPADFGSSHEAAAFATVRELARLLAHSKGAEDLPLSQLPTGDRGVGIVNQDTHHTVLPVIIARVEGGVFTPIRQQPPVTGDPYLTPGLSAPFVPMLRAVS